ncbi:hypothetical protein P154DRAFT_582105 [Amniculicola lignicola CBS 123094]|uniref:MFS general substrate transporter n=1 Tax=Amniculicola lignicola CBS 123094 TaxID=1392246 RepID=A0A6A5W901_9PLEO|nr:hypothetical protein P154DRAFT_582105 [Amniculicola lignicola CBS 123094]
MSAIYAMSYMVQLITGFYGQADLKSILAAIGIQSPFATSTVALVIGTVHIFVVGPIFQKLRDTSGGSPRIAVAASSTLCVCFVMFASFGDIEGRWLFVCRPLLTKGGQELPWWMYLISLGLFMLPTLECISVVPESPRWLVKQGRYRDALRSMDWMRNERATACEEVIRLFVELESDPHGLVNENGELSVSLLDRWLALWADRKSRIGFHASLFAMLCQQLVGINALAFMATQISLPPFPKDSQHRSLFTAVCFIVWPFTLFGLQVQRLVKFARAWVYFDREVRWFYDHLLAQSLASTLSKSIPLLPLASSQRVWPYSLEASPTYLKEKGKKMRDCGFFFQVLALIIVVWDVCTLMKVVVNEAKKKILNMRGLGTDPRWGETPKWESGRLIARQPERGGAEETPKT